MSARLPLIFALLAGLLSGGPALAGSRVALVIGNSAYQHAPRLTNPKNDASDFAATLRDIGFDVVARQDADLASFRSAVAEFRRKLVGSELAVVYYAGHGMQVDGNNFLVPVDAQLTERADVPWTTVDLSLILQSLDSESRPNIIFLDACRDNPFANILLGSSRSASTRGLTATGANGTLISFATKPDSVAGDGDGRNSPFTAALLKHIRTPGLEVRQLLTRVRVDVMNATGKRQQPWENSALNGDVFFVPTVASADAGLSGLGRRGDPGEASSFELAFWSSAERLKTKAGFEAYLERFGPNSAFAPLARERLARLERIDAPSTGSRPGGVTDATSPPAKPAGEAVAPLPPAVAKPDPKATAAASKPDPKAVAGKPEPKPPVAEQKPSADVAPAATGTLVTVKQGAPPATPRTDAVVGLQANAPASVGTVVAEPKAVAPASVGSAAPDIKSTTAPPPAPLASTGPKFTALSGTEPRPATTASEPALEPAKPILVAKLEEPSAARPGVEPKAGPAPGEAKAPEKGLAKIPGADQASLASDIANPSSIDSLTEKTNIGGDKAKAAASGKTSPAVGASLVPAFRDELEKRGCLKGDADGGWGTKAKRALATFARRAKLSLDPERLDEAALELVRQPSSPFCSCPSGLRLDGGACVPQKVKGKDTIKEARQPAAGEDETPAVESKPSVTPRPKHARRPVEEEAPAVTSKPARTKHARRPVEVEEAAPPRSRGRAVGRPVHQRAAAPIIRPPSRLYRAPAPGPAHARGGYSPTSIDINAARSFDRF